jgi:outer membrane protein
VKKILALCLLIGGSAHADEVTSSTGPVAPVVAVSTPSILASLGAENKPVVMSSDSVTLDKVSIDDSGNKLLVLIQMSRPVESFVFERRNPPSLFVQFIGTTVFASGGPIQVVGTDPLSEIRYGYANFQDAASANHDPDKKFPLEYLELKLNRSVFYHVQQEGWVTVVGLDRSTTKVDVPELDFRFDKAQYEGAANLPPNPRMEDFVVTAQANSKLLSVSREEADLAKNRVAESQRALLPALTAVVSQTDGREANPFGKDAFDGFEGTTYKRKEYGLQATQPIYQSGRLIGAYRQSKLNRLMALENVRKQAQDLTYEMKKAHISLLKFQSILRIRRELVAQGEVLKNMVKKKNELELTSKAEVLNVSAQADQAAYQLTSDDQDVSLARLVVISLLNQANPVPDPVPGALSFGRLSFNVESIINWAQQHRPDVRIAILNVELAKHNMKAAQADNSLKLDASGFLGRAGAAFAGDDLNMETAWNVGVRLSQPFAGSTARASLSKEHTAPDLGQSFVTDSTQKSLEVGILDALPNVSNARQSDLQYQRAQAELVEASRKAEYEVRQTYYNLEKASRQLEAVRQDLKYRQKDLDITREKVQLGLAELSQLMTAQVSFAQAQITEQDALAAYNIALADMDRVAGAEVVRG